MSLAFRKVKGEYRDYLVIFESGHINNPILLLDNFDIENLKEEWKRHHWCDKLNA